MSNLQITLSIVGVLLIVAIIGHGLWTMRRNNKKIQRQRQDVAAKRQRAGSADPLFDDDGVGEVRVVKKSAKQHAQEVAASTEPASEAQPEVAPKAEKAEKQAHASDVEQMSMNLDLDDDDAPLPSMRVQKDDADDLPQSELDLMTEPSPVDAEPSEDEQPATSDEPQPQTSTAAAKSSSPQPAQEVISLFVKGSVQGAVLLQMMTELGCKFGEMGIFHRYEQTSGNGPLIFSVANMFNPGTFDLDNIENFETDGVALFMTLPLDYDGQQAFNMMLNAAKKLAMEIPQGQVLDGQRKVLSRQSIQQAHQQIREFEKSQANA